MDTNKLTNILAVGETVVVEVDKNLKGNNCTLTEKAILEFLKDNPAATQSLVSTAVGKSLRTVKNEIAALQKKGLLKREGAKKNGKWIVNV